MRKRTLIQLAIIIIGVGLAALLLAPETVEAGSRKTVCGGASQRPCTLFEAFPSCDPGLAEDFLQNLCVAPGSGGSGGGASRPTHCGGEGERPCTIIEAFPSCEAGLQENFADGKCVLPGGGTQPEDVVNAFQPPNCNEIFNAANVFLIQPGHPRLAAILANLRGPLGSNLNALYNYKIGPEFLASLLWESAIPKDSVATPFRLLAGLTYFGALYCGLTLERDLALESEQALQENFTEVKQNVTQVRSGVSSLTSDVSSLTSGVAVLTESSAVTQQSVAAVASALATLDAETKQKLAALDARLQEVIRLLITPPGHRPGFPN